MRYNIIYWSNGSYEAEIIDQAENRVEALSLVQEYRIAFRTNSISFQRI
jgi:hypothetical protein